MECEFIYKNLLETIPKEKILINEPMSKHTSFKIGGNADVFIEPSEIEEIVEILNYAKKENIRINIIGNGTNLLVKDGGIRGITIKPNFKKITKEILQDEIVYNCGSGISLSLIANEALKDGATGLEFAYGIPGSLGGAVYMNAGAYGGEMKDVVFETTFLDETGNVHTIKNEEHQFEYRSSVFQKKNTIIIKSKLKLKKGKKTEIEAKMNENMQSRKEKQPLEFPNAGSVFKRGENFIAAKLIDECGLKGAKIGGAEVSQKHAGFIINRGNATANDVINLISKIKNVVKEKTGFEIKEEILIIGESK